jgi:hypothetical protein
MDHCAGPKAFVVRAIKRVVDSYRVENLVRFFARQTLCEITQGASLLMPTAILRHIFRQLLEAYSRGFRLGIHKVDWKSQI